MKLISIKRRKKKFSESLYFGSDIVEDKTSFIYEIWCHNCRLSTKYLVWFE